MQLALAKARAKRKQVFKVRCSSEDSFRGSYGKVRLFRIKAKFHSDDLISLERQFFSELLNIY